MLKELFFILVDISYVKRKGPCCFLHQRVRKEVEAIFSCWYRVTKRKKRICSHWCSEEDIIFLKKSLKDHDSVYRQTWICPVHASNVVFGTSRKAYHNQQYWVCPRRHSIGGRSSRCFRDDSVCSSNISVWSSRASNHSLFLRLLPEG